MVRGEIFALRPPRGKRGHEQRGARYGVIVQADELLALSTVLVCPTSTRALAATFRPAIEVSGRTTRVLCDQTRAIDIDALGASHGRLDQQELRSLDEALALALGL